MVTIFVDRIHIIFVTLYLRNRMRWVCRYGRRIGSRMNGSILVTLDDPNCRNCFRILLFLRANYLKTYATDLRPIFGIGSRAGVDDCCEIGLRTIKGRYHGKQFCLFDPRDLFRHSDQCATNFVHSATTRPTVVGVQCNTRGRPSTSFVDHTNTLTTGRGVRQ